MGISIEKRPANNEVSVFVFKQGGETKFEMEVNAVKSILLLWVFFAVTMFMLMIGQQIAQENVKMTAYLLAGNLTDANGQPVTCNPIMTKDKKLEWNCSG